MGTINNGVSATFVTLYRLRVCNS